MPLSWLTRPSAFVFRITPHVEGVRSPKQLVRARSCHALPVCGDWLRVPSCQLVSARSRHAPTFIPGRLRCRSCSRAARPLVNHAWAGRHDGASYTQAYGGCGCTPESRGAVIERVRRTGGASGVRLTEVPVAERDIFILSIRRTPTPSGPKSVRLTPFSCGQPYASPVRLTLRLVRRRSCRRPVIKRVEPSVRVGRLNDWQAPSPLAEPLVLLDA